MPTSAARPESAIATPSILRRRIRIVTTRSAGSLVLDAPDVAAVARVDADHVAGVHEERHVHRRAGFELRRLGRAGRRVALEARIGLFDFELDVGRQVGADRGRVVELDADLHPVLQEIGRVADHVALQREVLVRLVVHEVVAVGVVVEHLHLAVVHRRPLELLTRAERTLDGRSGLHVFQTRPYERRPFTGLDVEELDDGPELPLDDDGDAVAKIIGADHDWRGAFSKLNRSSVPCRRRLMFSPWRKMITSEAISPYARPIGPRPNQRTGAIASAASIDPTEAWPQASTAATQTIANAIPDGHQSAITAPRNVATPLPPLNPRKGDQQCPITAPSAANVAGTSPPSAPAARTGANPLSASSASTEAAPRFPSVRSAFAAPMFPLPERRMSVP